LKLSEAQIQKAVFAHLKQRGALAWHVPNGPDARRKSGYLEGCPDVHVLHKGRFYAIELKADGGRATEAQLEVMSRINRAGGFSYVAEGLDEAIRGLDLWGILK
jgi:hypothetical protein